jgi:hypothetical protein
MDKRQGSVCTEDSEIMLSVKEVFYEAIMTANCILLFMSIGYTLAERRSLTGLLFTPQVIYECGAMVECY